MRIVHLHHHPHWSASRLVDLLREAGHDVENRCPAVGDVLPDLASIDGVIIGGGTVPVSAVDGHPAHQRSLAYVADAFAAGTRLFGVCLGAQMIATAADPSGAPVKVAPRPDGLTEFGYYPICPTAAGAELFTGLSTVFQAHYESCVVVPPGAELLASSPWFEVQAFSYGHRVIGVQFHPDVSAANLDAYHAANPVFDGRPGAQPRAAQRRGAERHDAAIAAWCVRVLDRWLEAPTIRRPRTATVAHAT
ncbi:MAG: hypothetical protein AAF467_06105 [Actinomycetota bacterium]